MYLETYKKKDCIGCEACANICPARCISMIKDDEGFFYPKINENKCIQCNKCKKVCPLENYEVQDNRNNNYVYAVRHKDKNIQMESSSGGAFTAIAQTILLNGGIVYGSIFNDDNLVQLNRITTQCDLKLARKSKYLQSKMNDIHVKICEDLKNDKTVLFVGTPCQIDSVNHYIRCANVNSDKLFLVDIICHGVASPLIWKEYINLQKEKNGSDIETMDFRDKSDGWAPMQMKLTFKNGKSYVNKSMFDAYYRLFFAHYIIRPSCHSCKYTTMKRKSDITIGDFWGIKDIAPSLYDEYGVSMALVNSDKGQKLMEKIKNKANVEKVFFDNILDYQPNLGRPTIKNKNREKFWKLYKKYGFTKVYKKYGILTPRKKFIDDCKNIIVKVMR